MNFHFIVVFAFVSIISATSDLFNNIDSVVSKFAKSFENFVTTAAAISCNLTNVYYTEKEVTDVIQNFISGIETQLNETKTELPSQVSQILNGFCGLLTPVLGEPDYIDSVIAQYQKLSDVIINYLYSLVGKTDEEIHYAFCGKTPATFWNYFITLDEVFNTELTNLNASLNTLICIP